MLYQAEPRADFDISHRYDDKITEYSVQSIYSADFLVYQKWLEQDLPMSQSHQQSFGFLFRLSLASLFLLNQGCIHTKSSYREQIVKEARSADRQIANESIQVSGTIYNQSELPLSDFFRRLAGGEFSQAFRDFSLTFKPSNIYSSLISDLMDQVLIPAYIEVKNVSANPLQLSEKNFVLKHQERRISPIAPDQVPNTIQSFSPEAALANVYNVVVVTLAIFTILILLARTHGVWPHGSSDPFSGGSSGKSDHVLNDTFPKTFIDYKDYLISDLTLEPGETRKGLVFFNYKHFSQKNDLELIYLP